MHRFAELDMITLSTYMNANGARVSYYSGEMDRHLKAVQEKFDFLVHMQNYQPLVIQEIEKKVQMALD